MTNRYSFAGLALLLAAFFISPASAQTRPTAMTCDLFKKEVSLAITKTRRADAAARDALAAQDAAEEPRFGMAQDGPAPPPNRDYAAIGKHRRAGDMACAQRRYPEAIAEYTNALNMLGVEPPRY